MDMPSQLHDQKAVRADSEASIREVNTVASVVSITCKIERQSNQQHIAKLRKEGVAIYDWIEALNEMREYAALQMFDGPPPDRMVAELQGRSAEIKRQVIQLKGLV